jgi:hypothetical protein
VPAEVPQTLVALSGRQPALPPDDRVIDGYMLEETTDGFYYVSFPENRGAKFVARSCVNAVKFGKASQGRTP